MARLPIVPALLAALIAALAPAASRADHAGGELRFDDPAKVATIPFEIRNNLIYFRGRIGDSDSLWFVLDSGAGSNVVRASAARTLGLAVAEGGQAHGAGGNVAAGVISDVTFRIPGLSFEHTRAAAIPLDDIGARNGRPMDVILGYPLISRCVVEIDYAGGTLTLRDGANPPADARGKPVKLEFASSLPNLSGRLTVPGRGAIDGRFMIDTGSSQALILTAPFVRDQHLLEAFPNAIESRGLGVGGVSQGRIARVERFEVAGFVLDHPLAGLRVNDTGRVATGSSIGNLGGGILSRFHVTFDYPRKRMYLEPNGRLSEPFEADMSGLGLRIDPAGSQAMQVEWIQPNSPAAEAGAQPDDLLQSVDGRPALEIGMPGLRDMFRKPGVTYRLGMTRGGEKREITITTRRLI